MPAFLLTLLLNLAALPLDAVSDISVAPPTNEQQRTAQVIYEYFNQNPQTHAFYNQQCESRKYVNRGEVKTFIDKFCVFYDYYETSAD